MPTVYDPNLSGAELAAWRIREAELLGLPAPLDETTGLPLTVPE